MICVTSRDRSQEQPPPSNSKAFFVLNDVLHVHEVPRYKWEDESGHKAGTRKPTTGMGELKFLSTTIFGECAREYAKQYAWVDVESKKREAGESESLGGACGLRDRIHD